jgi:hypothetical protein
MSMWTRELISRRARNGTLVGKPLGFMARCDSDVLVNDGADRPNGTIGAR